MYLPVNPNSNSREINSRRKSAAASLSIRQHVGFNQNPLHSRATIEKVIGYTLMNRRTGNGKLTTKDNGKQDTYKHGKEGKRTICPWCISEGTHRFEDSNSVDTANEVLNNLYYKNDVSRELYVLDDRLYDYIEKHAGIKATAQGDKKEELTYDMSSLFHEMVEPGEFLRYCVKVSQLVGALTDDDYFLDTYLEDDDSSKYEFGYYRKVGVV